MIGNNRIVLFQTQVSIAAARMSDLRIGGTPLAKLKVAELKTELETRGLEKTGRKDELVARLASYMEVSRLLSRLSRLSRAVTGSCHGLCWTVRDVSQI